MVPGRIDTHVGFLVPLTGFTGFAAVASNFALTTGSACSWGGAATIVDAFTASCRLFLGIAQRRRLACLRRLECEKHGCFFSKFVLLFYFILMLSTLAFGVLQGRNRGRYVREKG